MIGNLNDKLDSLIKSLDDYYVSQNELLEKARKIVDSPEQKKEKEAKEFEEKRYKAPVPTHYPPAKPAPSSEESGIHRDLLDFYTTKIGMNAAGSADKPHDHASTSEHVIMYGGSPLALATVHHAHPSDLGKPKNDRKGGAHDHYISIHAPHVDKSIHPMLEQKVKDYVNSKHFKQLIDQHNLEEYDYQKPKWWLAGDPNKPKVSKPDLEGSTPKKNKAS